MSYDAAKSLISALRETKDHRRDDIQKVLSDPSFGTRGAATSITYNSIGERLSSITLVQVAADTKAEFGYSFKPIDIESAIAN